MKLQPSIYLLYYSPNHLGCYLSPDYLSLNIGKAGIRTIALGLFDTLKKDNVHIATVTVATLVSPGSQQASEVGKRFWQLHSQSPEHWSAEVTYPAG